MVIGLWAVSTQVPLDSSMRLSRSSRRRRKKMAFIAFCLAVDVSAAFSSQRFFPIRRIMALRQTSSTSLAFQNNGQVPFVRKEQKQNEFRVTAPYPPAADQPKAIRGICQRVEKGDKFSILRGCTGTGKTMVMAHCIQRLAKPTLVLCHNKTLAAQLARELRSFLRSNHVQIFVSYYNHYIPESYSEASGKYIAKKSSVNDELDALRHMATRALVQHQDVVVVASVSCIYGLGMPKSYLDKSFTWYSDGATQFNSLEDARDALTKSLFEDARESEDSDDLSRGQYELTTEKDATTASIALWPPSEQFPLRIDIEKDDDTLACPWKIRQISVGSNQGMKPVPDVTIFPAKHHISDSDDTFQEALRRIENECTDQVQKLRQEGKQVEADRLQRRVSNDLVLLRESGSCPGVENYSRHFNLREAGEAPDTLLDYFGIGDDSKGNDWMLMVDESHVTLPQLKAMYAGDRARKEKLVKHGYRLPSALDNRPLREDEFWERIPQTVFVSATPSPRELELAESSAVDMTIRPTYVPDPIIETRPTQNQLDDLLKEISLRAERNERTLALALTKKDAEDLSDYLKCHGIHSDYIHSGLKTHDRSKVLRDLQEGAIDCLVGVNILREGLDLPQVSLVAILSADSEGFLRSETALLQMIGRAARNINGKAVLYANRSTRSMKACIEATKQRRLLQLEYNERFNKEMRSTEGSSMLSIFELLKDQIQAEKSLEIVTSNGQDISTIHDNHNSIEVKPSIAATRSCDKLVMTDHIPSKPGVYFWKDQNENILYIGKAKKLRSRVKSYLSSGTKHSQRIKAMIKRARSIEFLLTPSERDALLLESNLIKHHQPPYNVLLKDDETYPYICASIGDPLPSFSLVPRQLRTPQARNYKYFGPYPSFREINEVLQAIENTYELRAKNFQVRYGSMLQSEYQKEFNKALEEIFLSPDISSSLPAMRSEYEEASTLFDHSDNTERDVVSIVKSEANKGEALVLILQLRNGVTTGQFSYSCKIPAGITGSEDLGNLLQTVLEQKHYPQGDCTSEKCNEFRFFPKEILVQYPLPAPSDLRAMFRKQSNSTSTTTKLSIRTPAKRGGRKETDEKAMKFAIDNAEEAARQKIFVETKGATKTSLDGTASKELAELLDLRTMPNRIEAYDISHTQGDVAVGSRVVFEGGKPLKKDYRLFNIRSVEGVDDYASIEEVLERRFRKAWINGEGGLVSSNDAWTLPDLVVIDGGKGQLSAAISGMGKAGIFPSNSDCKSDDEFTGYNSRSAKVPIVSLAKNLEEVFAPDNPEPINDSPNSAALLLLRALRDESHRFSLTAHRKRRSKLNGLRKA